MQSHLLLVRRGDEVLGRGSAWFVGPDRALTALHLVAPASGWEGGDADVRAVVVVGDAELPLEPVLSDTHADLALVRARVAPSPAPRAVPLADAPPATDEAWSAPWRGGLVSGRVVASRGAEYASSLELEPFGGRPADEVVGAPVMVGGRAVGLLTRLSEGGGAWAASARSIARLLRLADADDLGPACEALIRRQFQPDEAALLGQDLGWALPADAQVYPTLVSRAAAAGDDGLLRLLDEVEEDRPDCAELDMLRERIRRRQGEAAPTWASREARVREVLQRLTLAEAPGVALLAPLGFGAREVVRDVVERLRQPGASADLVVNLVPDRRTDDAARLYGALLRDVRRGLEKDLGRPLPPSWARWLPDRTDGLTEDDFEEVLTDLLSEPVADSGRRLVMVVDGLSRVPPRQLESWGWTMGRLSRLPGWRLLTWGGQSLYDLCNGLGGSGLFSVFHHLEQVEVGPLQRGEVDAQLRERVGPGSERLIGPLLQLTGGHPELVRQVLSLHPEQLRAASDDELRGFALGCAHLARLRQALESDAPLVPLLRELSAGAGRTRRRFRDEERRLKWLGVVREQGPGEWAWTAPVLQEWIALWLG